MKCDQIMTEEKNNENMKCKVCMYILKEFPKVILKLYMIINY